MFPTATDGVGRTRSSVGTCRAPRLSHVQPNPVAHVTTATVAAGTATTVASVDSRWRPVRPRSRPAAMKTTARAAGSFTAVASPHSTRAGTSRSSAARARPATRSPSIKASLWPEATKLNSASGLSTPSHSAIPPLTPKVRASRGRYRMSIPTPTSSRARNARTSAVIALPNMAAMPLVAATNNGPYGAGVLRHTLAIEPRTWPGPSTTGPTE